MRDSELSMHPGYMLLMLLGAASRLAGKETRVGGEQ